MDQPGYADIVIGLQFGDEGKARVVDMIAENYDIIARFNGGSNAGHTIETKAGKIALQQIPSGVFYPNMKLYIGSGCVVNIQKMITEIQKITDLGLDLTDRFHISGQASVVQPHHIVIDTIIGEHVGTTKNGIGPCYADQALRMYKDRSLNIRLADLIADPDHYFESMHENYRKSAKRYGFDVEDTQVAIDEIREALEQIKPFVEQDSLFMEKQVASGKRVLFEGAQSVMLDIVKGSVPYVTSSHTVAAAAYVGGDLSNKYHRKTIGVAKAVMSRVGHGPFPSELGARESEDYCMESEDGGPKYGRAVEAEYPVEEYLASEDPMEVGKALRILSGEYGTVTTRPRRIGSLDLVQLAYAARMNGVDEIFLNKCDVLSAYARTKEAKIPVATSYIYKGEEIDYLPAATEDCYDIEAIEEKLDSFSEDVSGMRHYEELPQNLRAFLHLIEEKTGGKIAGIGVGPERDQCVLLP